MIYNNANAKRLFSTNSSFLQFSQCETTALTEFAVVTNGLSTDGRAEESDWTNAKRGGFYLAGVASAEFSSWLIKPCANVTLPILAEMVGVEDCFMVLDYFYSKFEDNSPLLARKPICSLDDERLLNREFLSNRGAYLVS